MIDPFLAPPPKVTQASDDSFERVLDSMGNPYTVPHPALVAGDIVEGVVRYNQVGNPLKSLNTFEVTAYFRIQVASVSGGKATFAPDATFQAKYGVGAMSIIYEDSSKDLTTFMTDASSHTLSAYITAATDGTPLGTLGFTGPGGTAGTGEGWTADSTLTSSSHTLANVDLIPAPVVVGAFNDSTRYQFIVLPPGFQAFGGGADFEIDVTNRPRDPLNDKDFSVWQASNNGSVFFEVNVVPEPSSIALAGIGVVSLCGIVWLRRRLAVVV